jgi:chlorite dismutase
MTVMSKTRDLNDTVRYTMWSVFSLREAFGDADRADEIAELEELVGKLAAEDVVVRGLYDVSGIKADADLMVWWHAESSDQLQDAYNRLRRTRFGRRLDAVWSQMAREFPDVRANTVPAFALGDYEWILAFEADQLDRIVELMRHLRGSATRRHVRLEVPFYTGRRRSPAELLTALP